MKKAFKLTNRLTPLSYKNEKTCKILYVRSLTTDMDMHLQISQFEYTSSILNYVWLSRGIARICRIFVYRLSSSDNRSIKKFVLSYVFKQKKYRTIRHKLYWSIVVVSVRILRDNSLIKSVFFININTYYKNLPTCLLHFFSDITLQI